ncbi:hypothetical protein [Winogradskyella haliclonae]|uniref:Uncharacterized protein n=1 Tax=Winogradskyella haliclonae TaxID=2048558 RepID=A0ABQ2BVN3_9FLAO|nr:hypothetical protein [Winogradskyella haliclonae]GGI56504.1 hypothetical protein GCM10011444_08130 [Winogradskyella haliclonae]
MSKKSTIVPIKDAIEWTANYRKTMREGDASAFLIHASTVLDILKEMKVVIDNGGGKFTINSTENEFLRAYMAVDSSQSEANGQKLVFVGTKRDAKGVYRDMVSKPGSKSSEDGDGNTYNFTRPCPYNCDGDSPLGG